MPILVLCRVSGSLMSMKLEHFVLLMHTGAARVETAASETGTASIAWSGGTVARTETEGWTGHVLL